MSCSVEKSQNSTHYTLSNNVSPVGVVVVVVVGVHLSVRNQSHTSLKACLHVLCQALKTDRVQSNLWMLQCLQLIQWLDKLVILKGCTNY